MPSREEETTLTENNNCRDSLIGSVGHRISVASHEQVGPLLPALQQAVLAQFFEMEAI